MTKRRLPGPADSRLSEGDHTPEALFELFRDWQRTQTQSSVTALQGPRQQMDVWFCRAQEPTPRGIPCALCILNLYTCALSRSRAEYPRLRLTDDLHGSRLIGQMASRSSLKTGRSQPVDATLAWSLLAGVSGNFESGLDSKISQIRYWKLRNCSRYIVSPSAPVQGKVSRIFRNLTVGH